MVGKCAGLKDRKRQAPPKNDILEEAFHSKEKLSHQKIGELAKKTDLTERQVRLDEYFMTNLAWYNATNAKKHNETSHLLYI